MRVTVTFNISITLALIGYSIFNALASTVDTMPLMVEQLFPGRDGLQWTTLLLSIVLGTIVYVLLFRALWNRLFPHLYGWKTISLAESYAFAILMFLVASAPL
jgi:hypothetical protein